MLGEEVMPRVESLQGFEAGQIKDQDDAMCIFEVGGDEASIALLAGSVPHLQAVEVAIFGDIFNVEVDADCGLFTLCAEQVHWKSHQTFMRSSAL